MALNCRTVFFLLAVCHLILIFIRNVISFLFVILYILMNKKEYVGQKVHELLNSI